LKRVLGIWFHAVQWPVQCSLLDYFPSAVSLKSRATAPCCLGACQRNDLAGLLNELTEKYNNSNIIIITIIITTTTTTIKDNKLPIGVAVTVEGT